MTTTTATKNTTPVATHDGVEVRVSASGLFTATDPATGKTLANRTLAGLKTALTKNKALRPVTLLGTRYPYYLEHLHEVTVTGPGKANPASDGPRRWDGCGEKYLYARDEALKAEIDVAVQRQEQERADLAERHQAEYNVLFNRLVPLTDEQVKAMLYGENTTTDTEGNTD